MLKRYFDITLMAAGMLCITACDKKLDLKPEDTMTEKIALSTQATAEAVLGDTYVKLFEASTAESYLIGDITTGMVSTGAGTNHPYYTGAFDIRNGGFNPFWEKNYKTINLANVIITRLPELGNFDDKMKKQFVAEAKFIRAYCYSSLIKLYGDGALENKSTNMGLPLNLKGYDGYDGTQNIPRSTNAEVYTQIFKDIDEAIPDLPDNFNTGLATRSRATKGTANALGARVAMYEKDDTKAIAYGTKVLNNSNYSLAQSILDVFPDNSAGPQKISMDIPELILAFPVSWDNSPYSAHNILYFFGSYFPAADFRASFNTADIRNNSMMVAGAPWVPNLIPRKFSSPQQRDNVVAIRLAETMLTMAEALTNKNNVNQEAIDLLNEINQRAFAVADRPAPFTLADFSGKQELLEAIWQERRWELAYEGFDRFDFIRTGRKPNPVLPEKKYPLPIPYIETTVTGGIIKQNPGYID